jgi:hypothetical protein
MPLDKKSAQAYKKRWELVAEAERQSLRTMSFDEKVRQTAALMASAKPMGWSDALAEGDEEVRQRWQKLREVLGGKK